MTLEAPSTHAHRLKYRPDVDGLRAVAVLLVLAAHLRQTFLGGYIGVDIFFVISGYLISAHILTEMNEGRFRIVTFYERRIRRIFPALLVMLAATTALAWIYLFPSEFRDYGKSLLAALFSVSNMFFWSQAGYFDAPSLLKPLLHTWSLAVEEQFYVFFPILLVLLRRFAPTRLRAAIWIVTALSFALAVAAIPRHASAAFFFAPLRAWELLIGTILSQHYLPRITRALTRNLASTAGLLLIFIPALRFTELTPFPGLAALPPCLGAALLIAAGETGPSWGGRLLSLKPVVFVGLISYSLYLWHWPILVFQTTSNLLVNDANPTHRMKLAVFAVSLVMGTLSWWLVERPFRQGRFKPNRRQLFWISGAATAALTAAGVAILALAGVPSRYSPQTLQVAGYLNYKMAAPFRGGTCFLGPDDQFVDFNPSACIAPDPSRKAYLVMGDSHAGAMWPGLSAAYPELNLGLVSASYCPFLNPSDFARPACRQMLNFLYNDYLLSHRIDTVILVMRWQQADIPLIPRFLALAREQGFKVVLAGTMPEYDLSFPRLLASAIERHQPGLVEQHRDLTTLDLDRRLQTLARDQWKVPYLSIQQDLCTPSCPSFAAPGVPMIWDTHHLTAQGSIDVARMIRARDQLPVDQAAAH